MSPMVMATTVPRVRAWVRDLGCRGVGDILVAVAIGVVGTLVMVFKLHGVLRDAMRIELGSDIPTYSTTRARSHESDGSLN